MEFNWKKCECGNKDCSSEILRIGSFKFTIYNRKVLYELATGKTVLEFSTKEEIEKYIVKEIKEYIIEKEKEIVELKGLVLEI